MQQFRPLPRFEALEEAELAEAQPRTTTEPFATTGPIARTGAFPAVPVDSTDHIPILLLSGPHRTPATDQLAALAKKPTPTAEHPSLTHALQTALGPAGSTKRVVVIHADARRKKSARGRKTSTRHMSRRLRHGLVLITTLVIMLGALATLAPLSDGQNGQNIFQNFGSWIHSAQIDWNIQAHVMDKASLTANLPPMTIPDSPYVAIAEQDAIEAGISPIYFVRQINQESGFNPNAVSVTNAQGIAQFEPPTAASLGINPWDPKDALRGAARLMASYAHKYGNYAKALAAYNAGGGNLATAERNCGMNWLSCMPGQTQDYVYRIMGV